MPGLGLRAVVLHVGVVWGPKSVLLDFGVLGGSRLGVALVGWVVVVVVEEGVDSRHPDPGFGESTRSPHCWMWLTGVPQSGNSEVPCYLVFCWVPGHGGRD